MSLAKLRVRQRLSHTSLMTDELLYYLRCNSVVAIILSILCRCLLHKTALAEQIVRCGPLSLLSLADVLPDGILQMAGDGVKANVYYVLLVLINPMLQRLFATRVPQAIIQVKDLNGVKGVPVVRFLPAAHHPARIVRPVLTSRILYVLIVHLGHIIPISAASRVERALPVPPALSATLDRRTAPHAA